MDEGIHLLTKWDATLTTYMGYTTPIAYWSVEFGFGDAADWATASLTMHGEVHLIVV